MKDLEFSSAKKAVDWLEDQVWHDSVLYEIRLLRLDSKDQVIVYLDLLLDWEKQISRRVELTFCDCWSVRTEMNWGVECMSGGEMIYSAKASTSADVISQVRSVWSGYNMALDDLGAIRIDLSSTSSTIDIVFAGLAVSYLAAAGPHGAPPPLAPSGQ